jgi:hypothetical protein
MRTRIARACALVVASLVAAVIAPAHAAGPVPVGTFIVCGRNSSGPGTAHCSTLQAAIDSAKNLGYTVTIEMMPGKYCPPDLGDLHSVRWQEMDLVGIGLAAYGPTGAPTSFTGSEAALTTFSWSPSCGSSPPNAMVSVTNAGALTGEVHLRNLAVVGSASSPSIGILASAASIALRDVIVKGFSGYGIYAATSANAYWINVASSAVIANPGTGIAISGTASNGIDQSTIAGNGTGLSVTNASVNLINDTIAHNTIAGFSGSSTTGDQVVNTINASNAVDCVGSGWETGSSNSNNLVGTSCPHGSSGDALFTGSVAAVTDHGGPTPTIAPPDQAQGTGEPGGCNSTSIGSSVALDQREYVKSSTGCDMGAMDDGASGVGSAQGFPTPGTTTDLGFVAKGDTSGDLITVESTGGNLLYIYDVTVSGAGFTFGFDNCSLTGLLPQKYCQIGVSAAPSAAHTKIKGTVTVHLSTGTLTFKYTAHGPDVTALSAPSAATIDYGTGRKLTTTLTDTTAQQPIKAAKVTLQAKPTGQSAFKDIATRTTSATGAASVVVKPDTNTQYRWNYAGDDTRYSATSSGATVHVAQVVSAKLAKSHVAAGKTVRVTGTVTPKQNGQHVFLQVRSHGQWTNHGTAVVHGKSFIVSTTFTARGTHVMRVESPATNVNAGGDSSTLTLHTT